MAQNLVAKQQTIAANMASRATDLWNAAIALNELQLEYIQAGSFSDDNFGPGNSPQLNAYQVGVMLSIIVPALMTWMTNALPNNGPIPRDIFLQVRP